MRTIHYITTGHGAPGEEHSYIACNKAGLRMRNGRRNFTRDQTKVTCEACKQTLAFRYTPNNGHSGHSAAPAEGYAVPLVRPLAPFRMPQRIE